MKTFEHFTHASKLHDSLDPEAMANRFCPNTKATCRIDCIGYTKPEIIEQEFGRYGVRGCYCRVLGLEFEHIKRKVKREKI